MQKNNIMNGKIQLRLGILLAFLALGALARVLPHPFNFTPVTAMALFGGAYFANRYLAFLLPLAAMWISDLVLNNVVYAGYFEHFSWFGSWSVYLAFALVVGLGMVALRTISPARLLISSLAASVLFFLITNFTSWLHLPIYTKDFSGLLQAYVAGLPFFRTAMVGDLFYCALFFGSFEWLRNRYPDAMLTREPVKQ